MTISVVIPAFNEAKLLERTIGCVRDALHAFTRRGWTVEIIVCDNNSTDRTAEIARAAGAMVVFEPVNQISRARNRGAAAANGDWLIFIDADSYPSVGLFESVAVEIASGDCAGGGALIQMEHARGLVWVMNRVWNGISRFTGWAAGSFMFCRATTWRTLGGLSEELFASEEIDFSRRLKQAARQQGQRTVILKRHPMLTSARKAELCAPSEYVRLLVQTVWRRGANLRGRDACAIWYDGRR
jgi:glycosyltransferase involved in cell wall biosynthesis